MRPRLLPPRPFLARRHHPGLPRRPGTSTPPTDTAAQDRELAWQLQELGDTLRTLRTSLEDCYKLLGPDGHGSTLVVSTPRNEVVKGYITRLGTRIVKGTIHLKLRTQPPQTLTIDPRQPITIAPLDSLHILLTRSIALLDMVINIAYPALSDSLPNSLPASLPASPLPASIPAFITTQLRVLAQALHDASGLLDGPAGKATDPQWTTQSAGLAHFRTPLPQAISFYLGLQESQLVLWLRALEPVDVPVNLGMKFALALGTTRRLEHDEAEQTFTYCCEDGKAIGLHPPVEGQTLPSRTLEDGPASVYVREKIRIESADPSLLSLSAKLLALSHSLLAARHNLAAVMGEELEE